MPAGGAVNRAVRIISAMAETQLQGTRELYELSAWALRSAVAGTNTALLALMLMSALKRRRRLMLLDALTDPQVSDGVKRAILQALTASRGFQPYDVDIGGRYVRLAARRFVRADDGWRGGANGCASGLRRAGARFSAGTENAAADVHRVSGAKRCAEETRTACLRGGAGVSVSPTIRQKGRFEPNCSQIRRIAQTLPDESKQNSAGGSKAGGKTTQRECR